MTLKAGKYKLECWGAHGKVWGGDSQSSGGYSYGELTLKKETTLYVYTGATGSSNKYEEFTFNGGGLGVNSGGGGAQDFLNLNQRKLIDFHIKLTLQMETLCMIYPRLERGTP
ncbi:glycine rich domain-containing protein [Clostridioides difficile]|uniref:glycine rich domain-containing protein n=1 Tax=Clostridioides difficile TaxID=1496 RepID=UPI002FE6E2CA